MRRHRICFRRTNPGRLGHRILMDRMRRFIGEVSIDRLIPRRRVASTGWTLSRDGGQGPVPGQYRDTGP